jgi:hypothetical protein
MVANQDEYKTIQRLLDDILKGQEEIKREQKLQAEMIHADREKFAAAIGSADLAAISSRLARLEQNEENRKYLRPLWLGVGTLIWSGITFLINLLFPKSHP